MKIQLHRVNDKFHFEAVNASGNSVHIDANPAIGGEGKGARPMELLLMGLGGCSSIDVISILNKQKQYPTDFKVEIDGEREQGKEPSLFQQIQVRFLVQGEVDPAKLQRAVSLSMDKYCSVGKTLEKTATITYTIELNGTKI